ncbi:hypothetical protein IMY05_013G0055800 [Salix suchowensis]|nr:hypothetical protein IMY05_013G0055800 [Salix suchowensis]
MPKMVMTWELEAGAIFPTCSRCNKVCFFRRKIYFIPVIPSFSFASDNSMGDNPFSPELYISYDLHFSFLDISAVEI